MSFCAAPCCTCSPKVSCVSATSASWLTANVPPPCHFAFSCSVQHHKPSQRSPLPVRAIIGFAPSAVGRCWSSKDLRLRKSNSALHQPPMPSPHEITTNITKLLPASAGTVPLCLLVQQIASSRFARSSFRSTIRYSANLPFSLWAALPRRTSPVLRQTHSSLN